MKVMRLAAVLSDGPLVQRLMQALQQTAGPAAPAPAPAPAAFCTELRAICLTLVGCMRLASAAQVPAADALRIAHIAPVLAGLCWDELEGAVHQLRAEFGAAQGAFMACLAAVSPLNSTQEIITLVWCPLWQRCNRHADTHGPCALFACGQQPAAGPLGPFQP